MQHNNSWFFNCCYTGFGGIDLFSLFIYNFTVKYYERKKIETPPTKVWFLSVHKNNMMIIQNPKKININQLNYNKTIKSLNLNSIRCTECSNNSWSFYGTYMRYINFLGIKCRIKVTRIICNHCGKTHAVLIESMVPFSCLDHDDIINILESSYMDCTDSSHFYYLKNRFSNINFKSYKNICLFQARNIHILFVPT